MMFQPDLAAAFLPWLPQCEIRVISWIFKTLLAMKRGTMSSCFSYMIVLPSITIEESSWIQPFFHCN